VGRPSTIGNEEQATKGSVLIAASQIAPQHQAQAPRDMWCSRQSARQPQAMPSMNRIAQQVGLEELVGIQEAADRRGGGRDEADHQRPAARLRQIGGRFARPPR
jgi:hypothetical protein